MFYYRYYWTGSAAATHTQQSSKQRLTGEPTHKHINSPCLSTRYYPRFQSVQLFVQNYQPWTAFYITTHCARTWVEWKTHSLSTNAGAALAGSFVVARTDNVRYVDLCTLNFQNLFDHWLGALAHANKISLRLHHHHVNRDHEGAGRNKKYQKFFDNVAGNGRCKDRSYEWQ